MRPLRRAPEYEQTPMKKLFTALLAMGLGGFLAMASELFEKDVFRTSEGDLEITFIGHGSLVLEYTGRTLHVDPFGRLADYAQFSEADLVLLTHDHHDHLDPDALAQIRGKETVLVLTESCAQRVDGGIVMKNGDTRSVWGLSIEAVPAYNIVHTRDNGEPFHPKGVGNGYILAFGDTRVYVAGDTENTPEMKALRNIDIAFLPMNVPYTMTPEMVADAARAFRPKVLYPYHYGETDPARLVSRLRDTPGIEVRIRRMR